MRRTLHTSAALAAMVFAAPAWATATYPGVMKAKLSLAKEPECTVCHTSALGGLGTVNTSFGTAMRAEGTTGGAASASVEAALDALLSKKTDSDKDGVGDVDELKAATDPNVATGAKPDPNKLKYGCGSSVAPVEGLFALGAWILASARRQSRRR